MALNYACMTCANFPTHLRKSPQVFREPPPECAENLYESLRTFEDRIGTAIAFWGARRQADKAHNEAQLHLSHAHSAAS